MNHSSKAPLLEEVVDILVHHFGAEKVRAAVAKVSVEGDEGPQRPTRRIVSRDHKPLAMNVANALESIRESEPVKHRLLSDFHSRLKDRTVLTDAEDIRHYAQIIGLKDITGRSRKEMIPTLMRFLLEQPADRLQSELQKADKISVEQREQGFSVLTDKLLGKK